MTDVEVQAGQMALRRVRIAGTGRAVVSRYAFEETLLDSVELKIKIFDRHLKNGRYLLWLIERQNRQVFGMIMTLL